MCLHIIIVLEIIAAILAASRSELLLFTAPSLAPPRPLLTDRRRTGIASMPAVREL